MIWRNPKKEKPCDGQKVFVMLEPHKWRGTLLQSAESIQIVAGEYSVGQDVVENCDEYGDGWQIFHFLGSDEDNDYYNKIIAWRPVEDLMPSWFGIEP